MIKPSFLALILGTQLSIGHAATFGVNSAIDARDASQADGLCLTAAGTCSLRAAVEQANALEGNDIIELPPGTYPLDLVGANEDESATGDLDIRSNIAILAQDSSTTRITGSGDRVIDIQLGAVASLTRVTISQGGSVSAGGGIRNAGTLTLTSVAVSGNGGDARPVATGAGVFNLGLFTMVGGVIADNQAQASGVTPVSGGGIYSTTGMLLTGVRVENNRAIGSNSTGGGLSALAPGVVQLVGSGVVGNQAASGGGIVVNGAEFTINSSLIAGNSATRSGAGARVQAGILHLNNVTISGNSAAEDGGGIQILSGELNSFSSTLTNNSADTDANNSGNGGGIAQSGQGIVRLKNTLLALNADGSSSAIARDCSGAITSGGFNLIGSTQGCGFTSTTGDQLSVDPRIGPLADNGGVTLTHLLQNNSPALDAGDGAGCVSSSGQTLPLDQRGLPRTRDGNGDGTARCDVGAFELQPPLTTTVLRIATQTPNPSVSGQSVVVTIDLTSGGMPTGVVTVSANTGENCTMTLPMSSCALVFAGPGARQISASYPGDANFAASTALPVIQQVNQAGSTVSSVVNTPNPSQVGQSVQVSWTLAAMAPGAGALTGSVTVSASNGSESCTAALPQNSCSLVLTAAGSRTLTVAYSGDVNFSAASASVTHLVNGAPEQIYRSGFEALP